MVIVCLSVGLFHQKVGLQRLSPGSRVPGPWLVKERFQQLRTSKHLNQGSLILSKSYFCLVDPVVCRM